MGVTGSQVQVSGRVIQNHRLEFIDVGLETLHYLHASYLGMPCEFHESTCISAYIVLSL